MSNLFLLPIAIFCFFRDTLLLIDSVICSIGACTICMCKLTLELGAYVLDLLGKVINRLYLLEIALLVLFLYLLDLVLII